MKRKVIQSLLTITLGGVLLSGCVSHRAVVVTPGREVVVAEAPPEPRQEVVGVAPSASHAWIPGHWTYRHGHYVWVPGHWEVRPRAAAVYVPGHWDHTSRGWVWIPGQWE
jgi:WXXGXW repeat (2 copies)